MWTNLKFKDYDVQYQNSLSVDMRWESCAGFSVDTKSKFILNLANFQISN